MQKQQGVFTTEPRDFIRSTGTFSLYLPWCGISCLVCLPLVSSRGQRHPGDKAHVSSQDKEAGVHLDNSVCWSPRISMGRTRIDRRLICRACGRAHFTSLHSTLSYLSWNPGVKVQFCLEGQKKNNDTKEEKIYKITRHSACPVMREMVGAV